MSRGAAPPPGHYQAKTRYRQQDAACELLVDDAGATHLTFQTPQWAITPGQSAVVYDGDVCLGGGVIDSTYTLMQEAMSNA